MKLTDQQLAEFIALYKLKFGKELTTGEALEKGISLLNLMKTILLENKRAKDLIVAATIKSKEKIIKN